MAASQPNKATKKWDEGKDEEGGRPGWWERAASKVREEEAAEKKKKEQEAEKARRKHEAKRVFEENERRRWAKFAAGLREAEEARVRKEKWIRECERYNAQVERENRAFNEKVLREAHRTREKEEKEEEDERKRKGKFPSSTQ